MANQAIQGGVVMATLRRVRGVVEPGLRESIERLPAPMRMIAGYHFGWWDEHGKPSAVDAGKVIRPALVVLSAEAVGSTAERVRCAAVAVELVHNFSLLHDDVIDGDATRRHRPTGWSVFGVPAAILAGDALLTLAFDVLAEEPSPAAATAVRRLCAVLLRVADGQTEDAAFERRTDVSLAECVAMAAGKTGALMGCACALGPLLAGAEPSRVEHLRRFGEHLGLAFQIVDDLLGIWGDPGITGKPALSDLRTRKKSLPVVAALTASSRASRELARLYHRTEPLVEADFHAAAVLVEQAGGRRWAEAETQRQLDTALSCLEAADPEEQAAEELIALAHLVARRDH
jgi:geranylgeranyl diphosphate synthase, type I